MHGYQPFESFIDAEVRLVKFQLKMRFFNWECVYTELVYQTFSNVPFQCMMFTKLYEHFLFYYYISFYMWF